MASKASEFFKFLIIVSIFFGFAITTTMHYLPDEAKAYVNPLTGEWTQAGAEEKMNDTEGTLSSLKSANPVVQAVGLLQSGFYVIDLFLNSVLALPQMITIFFAGIFSFMPIDPYLQSIILVIVLAVSVITYILLLIGMFLGLKSGTVV
jgi:hypothetical protein